MIVVPAAVPEALKPFFQELTDAIAQLQAPGFPVPACPVLAADLPDPAIYPSCVVLVTDLNILAHSDGSSWIRSDTGAAI